MTVKSVIRTAARRPPGEGGSVLLPERRRALLVALLPLVLAFVAAAPLRAEEEPEKSLAESPADQLMARKLYADAARLLEEELKDSGNQPWKGPRFMMLGECYYLLGEYDRARPWLQRAFESTEYGMARRVAQYRMACIAYQTSDLADAERRTAEFRREFPDDERVGRLLLMKMRALAGRGRSAEREMEAVRGEIAAGGLKYGPSIHVAADKLLTDYYLAGGDEEKAVSGYLGIVNNFRKLQAQYEREKRTVPVDYQEACDYAAMQLGTISIRAQRESEAIKWLESVKFNAEMVQRSRLLLAQMAYQARDYQRAERYLLDNDLVEQVLSDELRSDMYLVLGFCAKKSPQPRMEKVFEYFSKVDRGARGYAQAQMGMADTALKWRQPEAAAMHFENARVSSKYEAEALLNLGKLYVEAAENEKDAAKKQALLARAADRYDALATKYAATQFARDADGAIAELVARGFEITRTVSDAEIVRRWETVVTNVPGTAEAARALLSIIRMHQKATLDEKTRQFAKAPDFAACADACNRLLDAKAYTGADLPPDRWQSMRCEALYSRGLCAVSSLGQAAAPGAGANQPVYAANPDLDKALEDLAKARELADPRDIVLMKNIEVAHLEGLFKSDSEERRRAAEKGFAALIEKYGHEPRLQKLATDLARWRLDQGQFVEAADLYRGVAGRAGDELSQDDLVKLLFMAGKLYSRAAQEISGDAAARRFGILIHPRRVIELAGILDSHKPFRNVVRLEGVEGEIGAEEALRKLSQASKIPFVWAGNAGAQLRDRRLKLTKDAGTVADFLKEIVDFRTMDLAFDVGMTRAAPTLKPAPREEAAPEESERDKVIEVYVRGDWAGRHEPVARNYGVWRSLHSGQTMMYSVMRRVEEITGERVVWADGLNSEDVLAAEYGLPAGIDPTNSVSVAKLLTAVLEPQGLAFRIVPLDPAAELYVKAKDSFNDVRKIAPKSPEGEEALFVLALNYYRQEDYGRMKIVLQEYLKIFDGPGFEHFHQANFWVGWVLEKDRRFREAAKYYRRAAEECLTVYRPEAGAAAASKEAMAERLSYDTRFALDEAVSGAITNMPFAEEFLPFARINTGVDVRLDHSAADVGTPVDVGAFRERKVYDILWDALEGRGLTFRVENLDKSSAEKAYYRLASCLKAEGMNEQALAACVTLLDRYPATSRRKDAFNLRLQIHKALKDYGHVLEDLEIQKAAASDPDEARQADYARAWVLMDLCRYAEAAEVFKNALAGARDAGERLAVREGYARALLRGGRAPEALEQYEALTREETSVLRLFVEELVVWRLRRELGKAAGDELPASASAAMRRFEALDEMGRAELDRAELTKVTWTYYVTGLYDLQRGDADRALAKLDAAAGSPDDWMAADAILNAARIHVAAGRLDEAREALEFLLFSTQSAEAEVQALVLLATVYGRIGDERRAEERLDALVKRFPNSAPGMQVIRERAERAAKEKNERREAQGAQGENAG